MFDDLARHNRERWEALAAADVAYSRPFLDLDAASARAFVDPEGLFGDLTGKDVLCLASGGGQQSVAFALLGARVSVLDFSETQLRRDREAAAHYGFEANAVHGDMRDLSAFLENSFDAIFHEHSINFIPDVKPVFDEVTRVLRPGGRYRLHCWNPFCHGMGDEDWNGEGYTLKEPYRDGAELTTNDGYWDVEDRAGKVRRIQGPREFRHSLSTLANGLIERGFRILGLWENDDNADPNAKPGTWAHFAYLMPPFMVIWGELDRP